VKEAGEGKDALSAQGPKAPRQQIDQPIGIWRAPSSDLIPPHGRLAFSLCAHSSKTEKHP
jgi:hypothetical protein